MNKRPCPSDHDGHKPAAFFETGIKACLDWLVRCEIGTFTGRQGQLTGEDTPIADEAGPYWNCSSSCQACRGGDGSLNIIFNNLYLRHAVHGIFRMLILSSRCSFAAGILVIDSIVGSGTRTTITLPAFIGNTAGEEILWPTTSREEWQEYMMEEQKNDRATILIVDDKEDLRLTLRLMLENLSSRYDFLEAERGEQAVEMVRLYRPHLVLMDVSLPGISGVEATMQITTEFTGTAVIGLSMHEREDVETAMREAGAAGYLTKDSPSEVILEAIDSCLKGR